MNFNQAVKSYQGHGHFLSDDGLNFYFLVPGMQTNWAIHFYIRNNFKDAMTLKWSGSVHEFIDTFGVVPDQFYPISHFKAYTRQQFFCDS